MVEVFREVRRVLREDGTLWLNLGDSYAGSWGAMSHDLSEKAKRAGMNYRPVTSVKQNGLKPKDLVGIPWRVAFALQADGWYLRSDIIWHKPNPMPESVTDRPTKAHEYLFLLTKSERYYYDAEAIKESAIYGIPNSPESIKSPYGQGFARRAKTRGSDKQSGHGRRHAGFNDRWDQMEREEQCSGMRNKRSVWTIATQPYAEAHFATFPPDLIKPCILAGSKAGDVVLDPFMGAGTTALVAAHYDRSYIGAELNAAYIAMAQNRIANERAQLKMAI
jgi:DNA modification methylase